MRAPGQVPKHTARAHTKGQRRERKISCTQKKASRKSLGADRKRPQIIAPRSRGATRRKAPIGRTDRPRRSPQRAGNQAATGAEEEPKLRRLLPTTQPCADGVSKTADKYLLVGPRDQTPQGGDKGQGRQRGVQAKWKGVPKLSDTQDILDSDQPTCGDKDLEAGKRFRPITVKHSVVAVPPPRKRRKKERERTTVENQTSAAPYTTPLPFHCFPQPIPSSRNTSKHLHFGARGLSTVRCTG